MQKGLTELVFIVDRSGSMAGLEKDTIGGFNAMLKEQAELAGEARVTTVLFDNQYRLLHDRIDIRAVAPLSEADYRVGGGTALLDAIGRTMEKIRAVQKQTAEDYRAEKVLFVIITDGEENSSRKYSAAQIKERIEHQKEKYGWECVFFGANMDAVMEAGKLGIAAEFARGWMANAAGTAMAYNDMSAIMADIRKR
ncbi:vWA domain-containing protein [Mogibacterium timidum]|uniref:vWA domain-containing protein n=1 Tax=Mogibacterium timidum TaxID=35519 RepID=UPI00248CB891|nr:vWA domain-containing protein [Mogibacterium timidum]